MEHVVTHSDICYDVEFMMDIQVATAYSYRGNSYSVNVVLGTNLNLAHNFTCKMN